MEEDITQLLRQLRSGDKQAEERLVSAVYRELRKIASRLMRQERPDHTLQSAALVNEAYIRLVADTRTEWQDRAHFFGVAAQVMRHVLVDHARQRLAGKRGAGIHLIPLEEGLTFSPARMEELITLEEALRRLDREDPRASQVVVFRYFGGLTVEEIAEVLRVSPRTVKRDWNYGRAWLRAELNPKSHGQP